MIQIRNGVFASAIFPIALTACGTNATGNKSDAMAGMAGMERPAKSAARDVVTLSDRQIADAGIEIARPTTGGVAGAIELPAVIRGDPQGVQVVSATIGGRLVALSRNLGDPVRRGDGLAVVESREAATLNAQVEAAGARAALAASTLRREQRLFAERVSPEQDLIAARTAATEADIELRLARQQLAATGGGGSSSSSSSRGGGGNRISVRAPISGQVIARPATLGQTVEANAELYRIANLSTIAIVASLSPADAGRVRPGARVEVTAAGRRQAGRVTFVSPVLEETTKLVQVIATLDNPSGMWRVGEPVTASILLPASGDRSIAVPSTAVQLVENRTLLFVRTPTGFKGVPVTTGRRSGDQVTVVAGLAGNERIATTNSFTLKAEVGKGGGMDME